MDETTENFGNQNHLCGTLCTPKEISFKLGTPCIVMLNSGLVYQAGPNRLHVDLAREIAELGFYSFRFDLSGIGDSGRSRNNITYEEQIHVDIGDALAFIGFVVVVVLVVVVVVVVLVVVVVVVVVVVGATKAVV